MFLIVGETWFFRTQLSLTYGEARSHVLELKTIGQKLNLVEELRASVKEVEDEVISLGGTFFRREDVVPFLELLEDMALTRDLEIAIHAAEVVDGERFSARFRFSLKGSFGNITAFVTMLENAPYLVQLQELSLSKVEENKVSAHFVAQAR